MSILETPLETYNIILGKYWTNIHLPKKFLVNKICRQELLLLGNEIAFNEAIIDERDQGIIDIQNEIGQANEIFKDFAVLVHEQGVVIGKI